MKCYAKSSVNLIARLANLHPKTTFFIKVFSFVFLVPEKRIIFAKVQRRIKSKIRLSYRLSFKLLVVNQSNMLHRQIEADKKQLILISDDSLRLYQNLCRLIFAYITACIRIEVIHYFVYSCLSPG